jgi:hypothetical protein
MPIPVRGQRLGHAIASKEVLQGALNQSSRPLKFRECRHRRRFHRSATNTPVVNGSVFNSGTITGTGGTAINFAATAGSGPFTLTLGPGSIINGNVLSTGGDLFQLGGATGTDTFNVSNIGASQQYRGFTTFNKIDGSTWFLTGPEVRPGTCPAASWEELPRLAD